mmetsp:Transcript_37071/g.106760  ORF Transcript_37071/g.106760 Transcript_37071/m.106760 type:complete len:367 (+) Transcript_37071:488-1588(+)
MLHGKVLLHVREPRDELVDGQLARLVNVEGVPRSQEVGVLEVDAVRLHGLLHLRLGHEVFELLLVQHAVPVRVRLHELRAEKAGEAVALDLLVHSILLLLGGGGRDHGLGGHGCQETEHGPRHEHDEADEKAAEHGSHGDDGVLDPGPVLGGGQLEEREEGLGDVREVLHDLLQGLRVPRVAEQAVGHEAREYDGHHEAEDEDDAQDPYEGVHHAEQQLHIGVQRAMQAQDADDARQPRQHEASEHQGARGRLWREQPGVRGETAVLLGLGREAQLLLRLEVRGEEAERDEVQGAQDDTKKVIEHPRPDWATRAKLLPFVHEAEHKLYNVDGQKCAVHGPPPGPGSVVRLQGQSPAVQQQKRQHDA